MEEDIKMLEKLCNQIIDEDDPDMFEILSPYEIAQAIKNLLTRYKQLKKENKELKEYIQRLDELNSKDFIFKSEIKEKIEELDKKRRKFTSDNVNNFYLQEFTRKYTQKSDNDYGVFSTPETITYCTNNELLGRIEALQELLKKE